MPTTAAGVLASFVRQAACCWDSASLVLVEPRTQHCRLFVLVDHVILTAFAPGTFLGSAIANNACEEHLSSVVIDSDLS